MCKTNDKIRFFSYFLNKLRNYLKIDTIEQKLAYKLHYCLCVESVRFELENQKVSLFAQFDNFVTLKNGPVEWDIYNNRDVLLGWKYGQYNHSFNFDANFRDMPNFEQNLNSGVLKILDDSFDSLKISILKNGEYGDDVQKIIELTHGLKLWHYSYYQFGEGERLFTKNSKNRELEYKAYHEKTKAESISVPTF